MGRLQGTHKAEQLDGWNAYSWCVSLGFETKLGLPDCPGFQLVARLPPLLLMVCFCLFLKKAPTIGCQPCQLRKGVASGGQGKPSQRAACHQLRPVSS
jgi:hypothetical protein